MARVAAAIAFAPAAQADTTPNTGPRRSWRIAIAAAPALLIIRGTASGATRAGPWSRITPKPSSRVPIPPMPVPRMQPTRSAS